MRTRERRRRRGKVSYFKGMVNSNKWQDLDVCLCTVPLSQVLKSKILQRACILSDSNLYFLKALLTTENKAKTT